MPQKERIEEIDAELKIYLTVVAPINIMIKDLKRERQKLVWEIQVNENLRRGRET